MPVRVIAFTGIGVFEEVAAVKKARAGFIRREVRGNPIQDNADVVLMEVIHQVHKVLGIAIAAGGGEITGSLVTP